MEFLRLAKRRTVLSETLYFLLNISLAIAVLVSIAVIDSPVLAVGLILISKWRVFAVRPRYWWAHVQANLVDIIVSMGFVALLDIAGQSSRHGFVVQIGLTLLYIAWIFLLKPRTSRAMMAAQAGVALAVGTTAIYNLAPGWPSSAVVVLMFVMGYAAARHVLTAYAEDDVTFLSLLWGMVCAQIGWLLYHWTVAYSLPFLEAVKLPQATIIIVALSFLAERIYACYEQYQKVRWSEVALPALLCAGVIAVSLMLFNGVSTGNI